MTAPAGRGSKERMNRTATFAGNFGELRNFGDSPLWYEVANCSLMHLSGAG
jgi:hypothetical protein